MKAQKVQKWSGFFPHLVQFNKPSLNEKGAWRSVDCVRRILFLFIIDQLQHIETESARHGSLSALHKILFDVTVTKILSLTLVLTLYAFTDSIPYTGWIIFYLYLKIKVY